MEEKNKVVDTTTIQNKNILDDNDIEEYDLSKYIRKEDIILSDIDEDILKYNLEQQIKELNINNSKETK